MGDRAEVELLVEEAAQKFYGLIKVIKQRAAGSYVFTIMHMEDCVDQLERDFEVLIKDLYRE